MIEHKQEERTSKKYCQNFQFGSKKKEASIIEEKRKNI